MKLFMRLKRRTIFKCVSVEQQLHYMLILFLHFAETPFLHPAQQFQVGLLHECREPSSDATIPSQVQASSSKSRAAHPSAFYCALCTGRPYSESKWVPLSGCFYLYCRATIQQPCDITAATPPPSS